MIVLSLFDHSGVWSDPYQESYEVVKVDIQDGRDVFEPWEDLTNVTGIIAQPPCTDFANAGARWFAAKDADGRTDVSIALVRRALALIVHHRPAWWVLENPMGRIHKLCPELGSPAFKFQPYEFGEPYSKQTWLWGDFNDPERGPVVGPDGMRAGQPPAWYSEVGGASLKTKNHRSRTPPAFAKAFHRANP